MDDIVDMDEFVRSHPVGFCRVPSDIGAMPGVLASARFSAPRRIDLRDYCGPTEDQGSRPWCAAYAASSWAENVLWRARDYYEHVSPDWIYSWAKAHDGDPNGSGTTLTAVLDALRSRGVFSASVCPVRVIHDGGVALKYALHRFGAVLVGFDVTDEWYGIRRTTEARDEDGNPVVTGRGSPRKIGGHAVLACGYNETGLVIQNSWSAGWGLYGFATVAWPEVARTFMYGTVLGNCLNGFTV